MTSDEKPTDESGSDPLAEPESSCRATLLLGAGASADAGVPLGQALDQAIGALLAQRCDEQVLAAWSHLLARGKNFEQVYRLARELGHLEELGLLDDSPLRVHVSGARALAGNEWDKDRLESPGHLAPVAAEILGRRVGGDLTYLDPLDELIRRQGRVTVSTLNYDGVIETWAAARGAGYLQDDDPGVWRSGNPWHPSTAAPLQLPKLHGSADWHWVSRQPIGHRAVELPVVQRWTSAGNPGDPAIILGAGNKLRPGGPFLALLEAFAAVLAQADHLIVVGYSFSDVHVNARIADWLDHDPVHRFITVISRSWPRGDGGGSYPSAFAGLLDRRLRLLSTGGLQISGHLMSAPSSEPRLRAIFKPARDALREALTCPEVNDVAEPKVVVRQQWTGR